MIHYVSNCKGKVTFGEREVQESTSGQWKNLGKSTWETKWQVPEQWHWCGEASVFNPQSFSLVKSEQMFWPHQFNETGATAGLINEFLSPLKNKNKDPIFSAISCSTRGFLWNMIRDSIKTRVQNHDNLPETKYMAQRCWILDANVLWNWSDQRKRYARYGILQHY